MSPYHTHKPISEESAQQLADADANRAAARIAQAFWQAAQQHSEQTRKQPQTAKEIIEAHLGATNPGSTNKANAAALFGAAIASNAGGSGAAPLSGAGSASAHHGGHSGPASQPPRPAPTVGLANAGANAAETLARMIAANGDTVHDHTSDSGTDVS